MNAKRLLDLCIVVPTAPAWGAAIGALALAVVWMIFNATENLKRANIVSGFDFLSLRAGFDISDTVIPFTSNDTIARAMLDRRAT